MDQGTRPTQADNNVNGRMWNSSDADGASGYSREHESNRPTGGAATNYPAQVQYDSYGNYTPMYPQNYFNGNYYGTVGQPIGPRFGLIRGYHRQMYEPQPQGRICCDCSDQRSSKGPTLFAGCNWGIVCGCVLLFIGVLAILMGFVLPQKARTRHHLTPEDIAELERIRLFIDIFVIFGLSVLSVGGLVVSFSLLWPFVRPRQHAEEDAIQLLGGEVYVKAEDTKTANRSETSPFLNLGFHKDFEPGDFSLRRVQPKADRKEPIDLPFKH